MRSTYDTSPPQDTAILHLAIDYRFRVYLSLRFRVYPSHLRPEACPRGLFAATCPVNMCFALLPLCECQFLVSHLHITLLQLIVAEKPRSGDAGLESVRLPIARVGTLGLPSHRESSADNIVEQVRGLGFILVGKNKHVRLYDLTFVRYILSDGAHL